MSGLRLGEIIFDARHFAYLPSLKALVCAGLLDGLAGIGSKDDAKEAVRRVDSALRDYQPESLIVLGRLSQEAGLIGMAGRWKSKTKVLLVSDAVDPQIGMVAEGLGFEVHNELVWGRFRFKEFEEGEAGESSELPFLSLVGPPPSTQYFIRVGRSPLKGYLLPVFLKGPGRIMLPSLDTSARPALLFDTRFGSHRAVAKAIAKKRAQNWNRCDVCAAGHARILPLGKVTDLEKTEGLRGGLPLSKEALGGSLEKRRKYAKQLV